MSKQIIKKILKWSGATLLLLVVVLGVHIYIVTRPKPMTANTLAMARIDLKQVINNYDADTITKWLYAQKGVDHVLCNPSSGIAVFSFHPIQTTANEIVNNFKAHMPYKAERFVPSAKDLQGGCPVAATSMTYKIYKFFEHIF